MRKFLTGDVGLGSFSTVFCDLTDVRFGPQSSRNSDLPGRTNAAPSRGRRAGVLLLPHFKALPKRHGSALGLSPSLKDAAMRAGRIKLCTSTFAFGN